jgi:signal transduction histidine kinase
MSPNRMLRSPGEIPPNHRTQPLPNSAGQTTGGAWSLTARLRLWFLLSSSLLAAALFLLSVFFVWRAIDNELSALAHEELDEFAALARAEGTEREVLRDISRRLAESHSLHPMCFEIWSFDGTQLLDRFGAELEHRDGPPPRFPLNQTMRLPGDRRFRTTSLEGDLIVSLLLDGRRVADQLQQYELSAGFLTIVALAFSMLMAKLFGRRLEAVLNQLADSLAVSRLGQEPIHVVLDSAPIEIRRVADELTDLSVRARQDFERGRVMIAGLAHELRAPIAAMLGDLDVTLRRPRGAGDYLALLERQREELFSLGDAVDNLVTHCRQGKVELQTVSECFDLGHEASLRLERARRAAALNQVEVDLETRGDLEVTGDREGLLRALRNLVQNAVQWSPPGSTVEVLLTGRADQVECVVLDRGPGIPAEDREQIFEPFNRGRPRQGQRQGYGLGLTITRDAVQRQGGSITLHDRQGGGTEVRVVLPRHSGSGPSLPPGPRTTPRSSPAGGPQGLAPARGEGAA